MIYVILLFSFLSLVFSSPRWRWLICTDTLLSLREEKVGFLFGRYMRDLAVVMLILWLLKALNIPWVYVTAGCVFFLRTLGFLMHMAQVLIKN